MASIRTCVLVAVLATILVGAYADLFGNLAKNESHHLVVGNREKGDALVYQENIAEEYHVSGTKVIVERNVRAPENHMITQVRLLDQTSDGTGAEATITGGGPGAGGVNLRFKGQRWHGVYFRVEVYAVPV